MLALHVGDTTTAAEAASRLQKFEVGGRRATYRLLAAWIAAEAAHRGAEPETAVRRIAAALEQAAAMPHAPAQSALADLGDGAR